MFDVFNKHADLALSLITSGDLSSKIEVQEIFARYTLESIGIIGFGVSVGAFSDKGAAISSSFGDAFNTATAGIADRFVDPAWKVKRLLNIGKEKEVAAAIKIIKKFAVGVIEERRKELAEGGTLQNKPDLLSRFMARPKDGAGSKTGSSTKHEFEFTNEELYHTVINFILAGRDTTAISLTWLVYELSKEENKHSVLQIREEHDRLKKELGTTEITYDLLSRSVYLKAAITEGLRLHPPVPVDLKEAEAADVLPDGTRVQKGERVMFMTWCMARLETQWENATKFKPERFLAGGAFRMPEAWKMPTFLAGPRICLGKDMAMLSSQLMLLKFLNKFDVSKGEEANPMYDNSLTHWAVEPGMLLKVDRRRGVGCCKQRI
jgi:cytochrome P450